jgi:argininosuccinate lyase
MAKKLWEKQGVSSNSLIEKFTVGKDREMDQMLAPFDVLGNIAHATMLAEVGLLTKNELVLLKKELLSIYKQLETTPLTIEEGIEDVHSQVEFMLTEKLGDIGKKIHSGRSRNDQVLLDLKLFFRHQITSLVQRVEETFDLFIEKSEAHKADLMPGYTHFQIAMPSSFGLWFGAYAESLADDLLLLQAAYRMANQNPLGSAAGYGSSFPLDRSMTADLLGFETLSYNVVYAQMGRGKVEKTTAFALASVASTLSKMAYDATLYMCQNFGFISFPDSLTTGSSIMPHKKNPDVFELIRAKCNRIQALPNEIALITNNLPHGYHRDMQLLKETLFPAFADLKDCLTMLCLMFNEMSVQKNITDKEMYRYIFSVEEVNKLVLNGTPFREAYQMVGESIKNNSFDPPTQNVKHTHEGSIGNLCSKEITAKFAGVKAGFQFEKVEKAIKGLIQ